MRHTYAWVGVSFDGVALNRPATSVQFVQVCDHIFIRHTMCISHMYFSTSPPYIQFPFFFLLFELILYIQ